MRGGYDYSDKRGTFLASLESDCYQDRYLVCPLLFFASFSVSVLANIGRRYVLPFVSDSGTWLLTIARLVPLFALTISGFFLLLKCLASSFTS